jgi:hypothetical protein
VPRPSGSESACPLVRPTQLHSPLVVDASSQELSR